MGLFGVWNMSFLGYKARTALPYAEALLKLPAHIQQLDMEVSQTSVFNHFVFMRCFTTQHVFMPFCIYSPMENTSLVMAYQSIMVLVKLILVNQEQTGSILSISFCTWVKQYPATLSDL